MMSLNKYIKSTIYFVLVCYLLGFIILILFYSQIPSLDFTTTTKSAEHCRDVEQDEGESIEQTCEIYIVKNDLRPYVLPLAIYVALIVCGLIYINRELKKITRELQQFEIKSKQALSNMESVDTDFMFHELNQTLTILNKNIDEFNSNEEKRFNYVSTIMHDLKTPLQVIRGYIDIFKSGIVKEKYITRIEEQIEHIDSIAQTTTYLYGYHPELEAVQLDEIVSEVIEYYRTISDDIEFEIKVKPSVWTVDVNGMVRCLHNLINNSLEAESTNINVTVETDKLEISDNGLGFDQEDYDTFVKSPSDSQCHLGLKIINTIIVANKLEIKYTKQDIGTKVSIKNNK